MKKPANQSWESHADEKIRSAYQTGEFDNLSGYGKPIPGIDEPLDELWWLRKKLKSEEITIAAPGMEIRTDIERTLERATSLEGAAEIRHQLMLLNERIRASNRRLIGHAGGTVMEVEVEKVVSALVGKW